MKLYSQPSKLFRDSGCFYLLSGEESLEFLLKKVMKNCLYFSIQILVLIVLLPGIDFKQIDSALRDQKDNDQHFSIKDFLKSGGEFSLEDSLLF